MKFYLPSIPKIRFKLLIVFLFLLFFFTGFIRFCIADTLRVPSSCNPPFKTIYYHSTSELNFICNSSSGSKFDIVIYSNYFSDDIISLDFIQDSTLSDHVILQND